MTDSAKKRLAIDLEEIERQLRQTAQQAQPSSYAPPATPGLAKGDPLAELARIVGQDDPFRAILSADRAGVQPRRVDPEFDDVFARATPRPAHQPEPYPPQDHGRDDYGRDGYAPYDEAAPDPRAYDAQPYPEEPYLDGPYAERPYSDPRHASHQEWREPDAWDAPPAPPEADAHREAAYDHEYAPRQADARYAAAPIPGDFDAYLDEAQTGRAPAAYRGAQAYAARPDDRDDLYADEPAYDRYAEDELYPEDAPYADERPVAREPERRSRRKLALVGAVLGVSVIGVAAAFVFSGDRAAPGDPPLILAEEGPLKVEPQNPGGVEIPDQDRQIFERAGEEETRVVDREEQPVDVAAVARQSPRVVLPPPAASQLSRADDPIAQALAGAIAPSDELQPSAVVSAAVAELGEPRRVRTVTVRPDGTIVRNEQAIAFTQAPSASGEPAPRGEQPPAAIVPSAPWRAPALPQVAQNAAPAPAPEPSPAQIAAVPSPVAPTQAPPPPAAAPLALTGAARPAPPAPQQTASVSAAPAAVAPTAIGGGYAVQLGIRDSQARAEQAFAQFRDRYSSLLGGASPIIMRAEVNGSTVYRVRVGPYALGDANTLCERIKGAGGDCFVARN